MNLSNLLSVLHLVLLPVMLYLVWEGSHLSILLAAVILLFSVLADFSGKIMGRRKLTVSFLHPFSDKIVVLALLLMFALKEIFSGAIFAVFLFRDTIITFIRINASRDDVVIHGELYGKTITALQFILVFLILGWMFFLPLQNSLALLITVFTLVILGLGVISIIHYGYVYVKGLRTKKELGKVVGKELIVILANKKSGGYRDKYRRYLLSIFAKRRNAPIYYLSGKDLFSGIEKNIQGVKNVVIAGGDGTFEAALNYKPLQSKRLGFFPLGAGNAFYSFFYKGKRFEYLRSRFRFHEVPLDVLELEWKGGKRETLFIGVGVDAEVAGAIQKKNHSFADYFSAGAKVAFGKKIHYEIECTIDGKEHYWENCINLIIGKVPYLGFGIRSLLGNSKKNDGTILGMACVNTHSPFFNKALRLWAIFLTQMGLAKAPLIPLKGKKFSVESLKPLPLQAGGEFLGHATKISVKVKRKQKVLVI